MKRTLKIASTLAAALMMSAPMALIATPSLAATHDNDRHDNNRGGNDNNRGGNHSGYNDDHGYRDRDYRDRFHRPPARHENIAYQYHRGYAFHAGHWNWQHNQWMWIAGMWLRH